MSIVKVNFEWSITGPLHMGTGMSKIGGADRLIRLQGDHALIPGDAVKGAVRGSAERLARWLLPEIEANAFPRNAVLARLFGSSGPQSGYYYRYSPATSECTSKRNIASTAIEDGVADEHTLRLIEVLDPNATFTSHIDAYAKEWSPDARLDLLLLYASLLAVSGVGGKKGAGYGSIVCTIVSGASVSGVDWHDLTLPENIDSLREHLKKGQPA